MRTNWTLEAACSECGYSESQSEEAEEGDVLEFSVPLCDCEEEDDIDEDEQGDA